MANMSFFLFESSNISSSSLHFLNRENASEFHPRIYSTRDSLCGYRLGEVSTQCVSALKMLMASRIVSENVNVCVPFCACLCSCVNQYRKCLDDLIRVHTEN